MVARCHHLKESWCDADGGGEMSSCHHDKLVRSQQKLWCDAATRQHGDRCCDGMVNAMMVMLSSALRWRHQRQGACDRRYDAFHEGEMEWSLTLRRRHP